MTATMNVFQEKSSNNSLKKTKQKQFLPRKSKPVQQKEMTFTEFINRITNN